MDVISASSGSAGLSTTNIYPDVTASLPVVANDTPMPQANASSKPTPFSQNIDQFKRLVASLINAEDKSLDESLAYALI